MSLRITVEEAYRKGFEAGTAPSWFSDDLVADVESSFPRWRAEYPLSADLDYRQEIVKLWRERLNADLDLTQYPECRGLRDIVMAEYRGYLDACGGNLVKAAYHFN